MVWHHFTPQLGRMGELAMVAWVKDCCFNHSPASELWREALGGAGDLTLVLWSQPASTRGARVGELALLLPRTVMES